MEFNETKSQERLINLMLQAGVEWPEGAGFAAQDKDGFIYGYDERPCREGEQWVPDCVINGGRGRHKLLPNWHQTIITREQYEARDGWITWHGGECPVGGNVLVDTLWGGGDSATFHARGAYWYRAGNSSDIIAYRIHKTGGEQPAEKVCESVEQAIPIGPTIEQLITEYNKARGAHDVQLAEMEKQREAVSEAEARMREAGEAVEDALAEAGWIERKEQEQPGVDDFRGLMVGDIVECVCSNLGVKYNGLRGKLVEIDLVDSVTPYRVKFHNSGRIWCYKVKLICRPSEV